MPKRMGRWRDKVEGARPLEGSACGHSSDQFEIGNRECLNAIIVSLLPLIPLSGCYNIEEPVSLVLHCVDLSRRLAKLSSK